MSPLYIKGARASSHCAEERHLCSMLRHRRGRSSRFRPNRGPFNHDCPWHQTCLLSGRELVSFRARPGTDEERARLDSVRPIGGAEEMKRKKPNEFNSSERWMEANSLDLVENG